MRAIFLVMLFLLGACFGSFLCCQARRLRLKEQHKKSLGSRSVCLKCHYQLKWYDNIPIVSWLYLKGKCRNCHRPIGLAEFFAEIGLALAFLILGLSFNFNSATAIEWANFILILVLTLNLVFLAIYDGAYGELPTIGLVTAIILGLGVLVLKEYSLLSVHAIIPEYIWYPILSVSILGGVYLILYLISHGKWVGDGDWLLGTAIALALFNPWLALVTLFLANLIASLIMYPIAKNQKSSKIHFGPFMVVAFIIVYSASDYILALV